MTPPTSTVDWTGSAATRAKAGPSSPSSSVVLASPTKKTVEMALPPRQIVHDGSAVTPSFELHDDPLGHSRSAITPRPSHTPHALPSIDVNLAQKGKRRSINDGSKRPTSPHITVATPTSARHSQITSSPERRSSMPNAHAAHQSSGNNHNSGAARSPSSFAAPVRQSSLGKAAAHAAQTLIDAVSGRNTPQSAVYVGARPDSASAINRRHVASPDGFADQQGHSFASPPVFDDTADDEQDKGHGVRRQSSGRWTPTILGGIMRKTGSPVHPFQQLSSKSQGSPRFQIIHTEQEGPPEVEAPSHGRKTPARYRSAEETVGPKLGLTLNQPAEYYPPSTHSPSQPYRGSHPLSHAHKVSISSASNSSHSIQMHSSPRLSTHSRHTSLHTSPHMSTHSRHTSMHMLPGAFQPSPTLSPSAADTANSSPLVVPQARRGAINLRPNSKKRAAAATRRRRAAALAAESPKKPFRVQLLELLSVVVRALRCPLSTARSCRWYIQSTLASIDQSFRDPHSGKRVWSPSWLGAYIPLLIWLVVSLSSTITVLIWHTQVFQALDRLSTHLQSLGLMGRLSLGGLIFLTTFPPLPLYSTLIVLCGFSFGLLQGFIISYVAALSGAIVVFLLSRSLLKGWMVELLNKSGGLKRVVRAIERRPKLLFLVRLAPYPYNLMNTLLASSPTLTLQTYTVCTALALPKLLVHCALGTSIKNFAAYNGAGKVQQTPVGTDAGNEFNGTVNAPPILGADSPDDATASHTAETIKHVFGFLGIFLCVGIFLYLFSVARKAVDEELDDEGPGEYDLVLSDDDYDDDETGDGREEAEESDLDHDDLNIARGSSESAKDDVGRAPVSFRGAKAVSLDQVNSSSDSTLVDGLVRPVGNSTDMSALARVNQKFSPGADGTTPNYMAPRPYDDSGNPYFCGNRTNRHFESQVSLADSIVEMEKHAVEMEDEQPPLFRQQQPEYVSSYTEESAYAHEGHPAAARRHWGEAK